MELKIRLNLSEIDIMIEADRHFTSIPALGKLTGLYCSDKKGLLSFVQSLLSKIEFVTIDGEKHGS